MRGRLAFLGGVVGAGAPHPSLPFPSPLAASRGEEQTVGSRASAGVATGGLRGIKSQGARRVRGLGGGGWNPIEWLGDG